MANKINTLLASINTESLHRVHENDSFKILDVMTVEDIEASLHEVTHMALMNLVVEVNRALAS